MRKSIICLFVAIMLSACAKKAEPAPEPDPEPVQPVEKCDASEYKTVTIGSQVWMAENYRCLRYAPQSEAYKSGMTVVPSTKSGVYTPYYKNASDKTFWNVESRVKYGIGVAEEQINKMGFLYNWAAAAGVSDGSQSVTGFHGMRQGICPDGWHLPTAGEWSCLQNYIKSTDSVGKDSEGKFLKSASGWYKGGNGLDSYGFAALPAGYSVGDSVAMVGCNGEFWSASADDRFDAYAYYCAFVYQLDYMYVGSYVRSEARSVRCVKNDVLYEELSLSEHSKDFCFEGGSFNVEVTSNTSWSVATNKSWVTLSATSGMGNGIVSVDVAETTVSEDEEALVSFTTPGGKVEDVKVFRKGFPAEKCSASDYPVVTIGKQTWMAENYRCSKYDTESEAYKEGRTSVTRSKTPVYTPYYNDYSDRRYWDATSLIYGADLTDEQVARFGYMYNWAAAVGADNGLNYYVSEFSGNRQGICPNGWHVPKKAEWDALAQYVEGIHGENTAGTHLRSSSGWYDSGNGSDTYSFDILPAGDVMIGQVTYFITATPTTTDNTKAYNTYWYAGSSRYMVSDNTLEGKKYLRSLRCVQN